jgi:two-component system sensor histidine kinase CiaH
MAGGPVADRTSADVFTRARMRLALLFVTLVIVLVVVSSVFMYLTVRSDIQSAARGSYPSGETEQEYVSNRLGTLRWQLVAVDAVIVVLLGVGGLVYARSTLRPIRESVAAQKRFVADASHDLRTPLAIMKADFEVALRDSGLAEGARPVLESGLEEVDRMSAMVEDLLTLSRIDANTEQVAREPLDLATLARQTVRALGGLAAASEVRLAFEAGGEKRTAAADDGELIVSGDERHLRRALANVVRNAIEHSPPGAPVVVAARSAARDAELVVTDHGEGIPPAELAHVFDRFYRGDPARTQARGGSGLGLAIARWAVREMGGDLSIESTPGNGTRVTLRLPRRLSA